MLQEFFVRGPSVPRYADLSRHSDEYSKGNCSHAGGAAGQDMHGMIVVCFAIQFQGAMHAELISSLDAEPAVRAETARVWLLPVMNLCASCSMAVCTQMKSFGL